MGRSTDANKGAELSADRALLGGEHCVGSMLVLHGDDVVCENVGILFFCE